MAKRESFSFEKAIERLEEIIRELESGDVPLDDAMKLYDEGMKLSSKCEDYIAKAEKRVLVLDKDKNRNIKEGHSPILFPFEDEISKKE